MAQIAVNRDYTKIKKKVAFGLTKRQLLCFAVAGVLGFLFYWSTRKALGTTLAVTCMILLIMPVFFLCQYERDGRHLEDIMKDMIRTRFARPGIRRYEAENIYSWLDERVYEKSTNKKSSTYLKN